MSDLQIGKTEMLGMPLTVFRYKGVSGSIGEGDDWVTIYHVQSTNEGKGECQECLLLLKAHFEPLGKRFGCSVALNPAMHHILQKLGIHEYTDYEEDDQEAPCEPPPLS